MTTIHGSKMPLMTAFARPFLMFKEALSLGEDCWTWTTLQGDVYEDVVLVHLGKKNVTIRHKYGETSVARADLSHAIQKSLIENFEIAEPHHAYSAMDEQAHYLSALPMAHAK